MHKSVLGWRLRRNQRVAYLVEALAFGFPCVISMLSSVTFDIWKTDSVIAIASHTVVSEN